MLGHPHTSEDTAQVSCCISWEKSLSCQVLCSSSLTRLTELLLTLGFNTPDDGHALPERGSWHWMSLKFDLSADLTFKMPAAAGWWDSPCEGAGTGPCLGGIKVKPPPAHLGWEGNAADAGGMSKELEINQQRGEKERARLGEGVLCISMRSPATSLPSWRAIPPAAVRFPFGEEQCSVGGGWSTGECESYCMKLPSVQIRAGTPAAAPAPC